MSVPFHTINMATGGLPALADHIQGAVFPNVAFGAANTGAQTVGALTAGTGYTSAYTVTVTPTGGTGSGQVVRITSLKVVSATVAAGGTGYVTNDTLNMGNGVTLTVTATAGAITALAVTAAGSVQNAPTNPVSPVSTSGVGIGASINMVWGLGTVVVLSPGTYTAAPTGYTIADTAATPGTGGALAAGALGGNGTTVVVPVSTGFILAMPYTVQATPSLPALVSVIYKSPTAFTIGLTPVATATLGAGTVDIFVLG